MDTVCFNPENNVTFCAHNLHKLCNLGIVAGGSSQYFLFYVELVNYDQNHLSLPPQSAVWIQNAFGNIQ